MQSPDTEDRLSRIRARLDEMQRRTMSSLTVTNPVDGIQYLAAGTGHVYLFDPHGTLILASQGGTQWGYLNPWQDYVMFQAKPTGSAFAFTGALQTTLWATLYPNQPRMQFTVDTQVNSSSGAIADTQVSYTVNGGSPVTVPVSVAATSSTTRISTSFTYLWPSDLFGAKVRVSFQARIRTGTGNPALDSVVYAPTRIYGAPQ